MLGKGTGEEFQTKVTKFTSMLLSFRNLLSLLFHFSDDFITGAPACVVFIGYNTNIFNIDIKVIFDLQITFCT